MKESKDKPFIGKKVLFTSHRTGFANTFNRPLIKLLKDMGAEVHYASNGEEKAHNCDKEFILSISRSPFSFGNIKAYRQLKTIIKQERYDLIHCHTPTGGVVTRLAAIGSRRESGTRVIYTAHGFHFFKGARLLNWLIYYPIEKFMARYTDALITINKEDYWRAKRRFKSDVRYVPGVGFDVDRFGPRLTDKQRSALRKSLNIKPNDFVMVYPAELNKNKNQSMLIQAMSTLVKSRPDIHLLLPGKDGLNGRHRNMIAKMGLANNVHLLGYRTDIPKLLQAADVSVSASYREGLPVNIMEALYAGLPVVATDCRGNADLLEGVADCMVSPKNDQDAFLKHICKLYETRYNISHANRLSKEFYLSSILPRMRQLYRGNLDV